MVLIKIRHLQSIRTQKMARILILDNYDSFTFNLVHYVEEFGVHQVDVFRNDQILVEDVFKYDGIVLSPGPGIPCEAGNLLPIIEEYSQTKRILGVCLGQQAIAEVFGGSLLNLSTVYHGIATKMEVAEPVHYLFNNIPKQFEAGRYHSWVVNPETLPMCLQITATDENNQIMALCHNELDVCGVQFHPESILTPNGKQMIFNWLRKFQSPSNL